jgi:hypothetical protein
MMSGIPKYSIEAVKGTIDDGKNVDILNDTDLTTSWLEDHVSSWGARGYVEAQFHGGLTPADIDEVIFSKAPPAPLRKTLEGAGVPWRVVEPDAPYEQKRQAHKAKRKQEIAESYKKYQEKQAAEKAAKDAAAAAKAVA